MKNLLHFLFASLLFLATSLSLQAQNFEQDLPEPDNLSSFFIGNITQSGVYYGAAPAGSENKPVVVFVHGFVDLNNLWFLLGNDMYEQAYDAGYRTAFVAMTRGDGMWTNGAILADQLETITDHYSVDDVVIVAHSNGGKASEVAMLAHGKYDLVDRVISLGTPFRGTQVANLAETFWFRWLVDFIGLGGGTGTSTTYYMDGVARPYLDNHPNNQTSKFINFGGTGYYNGTTITAPVMAVGGFYIKSSGGGANDGVTPYYSSTRPGGLPYWTGKVDHIDIAMDYIVWDDVQPVIEGSIPTQRPGSAPAFAYDNGTLESNYQLLNSENGSTTIAVGKSAKNLQVEIMHEVADASFSITSAHSKKAVASQSTPYLGGFSTKVAITNANNGAYKLSGTKGKFMGIASFQDGVKLKFNNNLQGAKSYAADAAIRFTADLEGSTSLAGTSIKASITRTTDLDGTRNEGLVQDFDFELNKDGQFILNPGTLKAGVYNVFIEAKGKGFVRHLVTGFAVNAREIKAENTIKPLSINSYPNPARDAITLQFDIQSTATANINIFDAVGRTIWSQDVSDSDLGQQYLNLNLDNIGMTKGVYIIEFNNGQQSTTSRFVKL